MALAMTKAIANWWRSRQFRSAIAQGGDRQAAKLLQDIQKSGAKLSLLEQQFRDKLQAEKALQAKQQEFETLTRQYSQAHKKLSDLEKLVDIFPPENLILPNTLIPDEKFIEFISESLIFVERDKNMIQCTGIETRIFEDFEAQLADFIQEEFTKISLKPQKNFYLLLKEAIDDINKLKSGQDPEYKFELSSHVYLMRYFLDNVYCAYIAWFLIYKAGLLPTQINILDIAAGPGTIAYGLALLLQSSSGFFPMPQMHVSYYSLEQQKFFQFRGLQFWRQYIETQPTALNAYFRFNTVNIFDYPNNFSNLPKNFYDFIAIAHCFFSDVENRAKSQKIYKEIFKNYLKESGYILLIIQDKKLLKACGLHQNKNHKQEENAVKSFLEELGLNLVWYKYLSSKDKREPISDFSKFARENLAEKKFMGPLLRKYFKLKFDSNYTLDDYVILAKKG